MQNQIDRRKFMGFVGAATVATAARGAGQRPPNFVLIFADDQGYQDMGCFGSPKIKTPNMDRMAKEGTRFTDFYSAAPVCTPSRVALLTGCYPPRTGVTRVLFPRDKTGINPKEITVAEILKARGYATACVGKWHLGHHPRFLPTNHGFDSYFGIPYSNDMTIDPKMALADDIVLREGMTRDKIASSKPRRNRVPLMRGEKVVEYPCDQSTLTKRYTEESIRFITANKDRPFLLYLPHTMPHVPLFASKKFKGKSERGLYGDVIEEMDWSVGKILDTLKKLGIDKNTLVVYTSDNGPWLSKGKHGGCALPLRGGKFQTYDGGMREPTIMWWPGTIPAGRDCDTVCGTIDMLPTFAALAGAKVPADRVIDGRSIVEIIKGKAGAKSPHEDGYFYYRGNRISAVRAGRWKLRIGGKKPKGKKSKGRFVELYDLEADISEKNNLAKKHPEIVKDLRSRMEKFDRKLKASSRPCGRI